MDPAWLFTSEALMNYMPTAIPIHKPWDLAFVGAKLEAFAIAGCNVVSKSFLLFTSQMGPGAHKISDLNQTSKQKADNMKRQIWEKIGNMLGMFLYCQCILFVALTL